MPIITPSELVPMIYDPARIQQKILSNVTAYNINEASNPFIMLMEAASTLSAASAIEAAGSIKKLYPSLATDPTDILHHISDKELPNVFSTPAETSIIFYISVRDLRSSGYRATGATYSETIIPAGTEVSVTNVPFTLLNDISVKLYDGGSVFAEQLLSNDPNANNSLGVLASGIVNFEDGEPWIAIETMLTQLKKNVITNAITVSEGFKLDVKHTDKYHSSEVFFKSSGTNNQWAQLVNSHSDSYIDPAVPTVFISVMDNLVTYEIPDVYLISGMVSGEVMINMYETVGYLDMPIHKYSMSDFLITLNTATNSPIAATIANIAIAANSRDTVNGGKTGYTFDELKNMIVNNSLGSSSLPITFTQLQASANRYGFEIFNASDLVTERIYMAMKNMSRYSSNLVYAKPDIFFNTVNVDVVALNNSNAAIINNSTQLMIPSDTVFKEVNGVVSVVTDAEMSTINAITTPGEVVSYMNTHRLFYTPYYYIIDTTTTGATETKVFDLDAPVLSNIKIEYKNLNVPERVNVGKYGLFKTSSGYDFVITILANSDFNNTNTTLFRGQLSIAMYNGGSVLHIAGTYDPATTKMTFPIRTKMNLDASDRFEVLNGVSDITNKYLDLITKGSIYLYTTDSNVVDPNNELVSEIMTAGSSTNLTVLDKEVIDIEFGNRINTIWNPMYSTYTPRMYLKHTVTKPLVYKQDVYKLDPLTGSAITTYVDAAGVTQTKTTLLHAKGDPVLDANGVPINEYTAGDTQLGADGKPVIDLQSGVARHIDVLMLDYMFKVANSSVGQNYLTAVTDTLRSWLFNDMASINALALENTKILYRSYKKSEPVEVGVESTITRVPYVVTPIVTVYSTRASYTTAEIHTMKTEIGYIIHEHLDMLTINLGDTKTAILNALDSSVVSVKLSNIEVSQNGEIFNMVNPMTRLTPAKSLSLNSNNEYIVNYNIDLKIHTV